MVWSELRRSLIFAMDLTILNVTKAKVLHKLPALDNLV